MAETNGSDDTPVETGDVNRQLVSSIQGKLGRKSPLPAQCCIFRVPVTLRKSKKNAYVPNIVSIGPYHHGKRNLKAMERVKLWYLNCLLERSPTKETSLDYFVKGIRDIEQSCRECYADEQINYLSSDQFIEMMVIDGCFIIEYFRKNLGTLLARDKDDPVFNMSWMTFPLVYDFLLLENQLPWQVLDTLWSLTATPYEKYLGLSLHACFLFYNVMPVTSPVPSPEVENKHLLDFLRNSLLSSFTDTEPEGSQGIWKPIPSVTELLQAGVRFKKGKADGSLYIKFSKGVMEISPILIQEGAEYLIRNLVAFEQCYPGCNDKIASYAIVLDNLINSCKDVDYLCDKGIITTFFSHEDLANIFFRLCSNCGIAQFAYVQLCADVNKYYKARCPRWQAILRRDYFGNPWSITSFLAAILILSFTFTQTLFSILAYKVSLKGPNN